MYIYLKKQAKKWKWNYKNTSEQFR